MTTEYDIELRTLKSKLEKANAAEFHELARRTQRQIDALKATKTN